MRWQKDTVYQLGLESRFCFAADPSRRNSPLCHRSCAMNVDRRMARIIRCVLPNDIRAESGEEPIECFEAEVAQKLFGLHGYYANGFDFTDIGLERWKCIKSVEFPAECCVCGQKPEIYLSVYKHGFLTATYVGESVLNGVPHCAKHGRPGRARLVVQIDDDATGVGAAYLESQHPLVE